MGHSKLVGAVSNCAVSTDHGTYAVRFPTAPARGESVYLFLAFTIRYFTCKSILEIYFIIFRIQLAIRRKKLTFEMIDSPEPNFPVNLFAPDEDTADDSNSERIAISCCTYSSYLLSIDSIWATDADE